MNQDNRVPFPPDPNPRKPKLTVPEGSWDTHFHVYAPHLFPYVEQRRYTPPAAPIEHYLAIADVLGIKKGVVVQPNVHGGDVEVTLDAIAKGDGRLIGIVRDDPGMTASEVLRLDRKGVRGIRFTSVAALRATLDLSYFRRVAGSCADAGWIVDLHVDASSIVTMADVISGLKTPVVIDAWARINASAGIDQAAVTTLVALLRGGNVWVKFAAPNRFAGWGVRWEDLVALSRLLVSAAPDRILWGSDWPHSDVFRPNQMPNDGDLLDALQEFAPAKEDQERILVRNPERLFGATR